MCISLNINYTFSESNPWDFCLVKTGISENVPATFEDFWQFSEEVQSLQKIYKDILMTFEHPQAIEPFKPQYPHTNSPNWSLYISLKNELREFDKRSKYLLLGDHLINSHNLISWQRMDVVRRKLLLVTVRTYSL